MKAGWEVKALGEVCEILDRLRKPITKRNRVPGAYPYYGATGILDHVDGFLFDEPLVLVGEDGAKWGSGANSAFRISGKTWVNNHAHVLRPRSDELVDEWLVHYLNFSDLMPFVSGMTVPKLNQGNLREIPIPLPPLDEQKRIVAVLDAAFEGLTRARTHVETNLQHARELFENYREGFLTPSRRQGWSHRKLDDLITIKHGFAFKSAFFVDDGQYAVLTPGNYHEAGGFRDRGEKQRYYSGEFPSEFLLRKGDLLVAMTEQAAGLLGSCMIVPENESYLHNQRLGLISPKDGIAWSPEYFAQAFNLKTFRKGLSDTCSGATVRHTSPKRILAESIPYSDNKGELEAAAFNLAEREQDCRTLEKAYREKTQDLDDLRQSLLQKAFAGELT